MIALVLLVSLMGASAPCEVPETKAKVASLLQRADNLPRSADERETLLAFACEFLARPEPAVAAPPDRELLAKILERPEFSHAREGRSDFFARLARWIQFWAAKLFESNEAASFSNAARVAVLAAAFAIVFVLAAKGLRWRRTVSKSKAMAPSARAIIDDPSAHLARARSLELSQPREAIREGLLCILGALERRRLARTDRAKTNRELVAELPERGAPHELSQTLGELLGWYDRAFYSLGAISSQDARAFLDRVEQLRSGVLAETP